MGSEDLQLSNIILFLSRRYELKFLVYHKLNDEGKIQLHNNHFFLPSLPVQINHIESENIRALCNRDIGYLEGSYLP